MPTQIRLATTGDYPGIMEIWESAVRATHDFLLEEDLSFFKRAIPKDYLPNLEVFILIENGKLSTVIPLFNKDVLSGYLPLINVFFALAIIKEYIKLITGKWTISLAAVNAVLNAVSLVISIVIFTNPGIWNGEFTLQLLKASTIPVEIDINMFWRMFTNGLIFILAFAFILDSITALLKARKQRA